MAAGSVTERYYCQREPACRAFFFETATERDGHECVPDRASWLAVARARTMAANDARRARRHAAGLEDAAPAGPPTPEAPASSPQAGARNAYRARCWLCGKWADVGTGWVFRRHNATLVQCGPCKESGRGLALPDQV